MINGDPDNTFAGVIEQVMGVNQFFRGNQTVSAPAAHPFDFVVKVTCLEVGAVPAFGRILWGGVSHSPARKVALGGAQGTPRPSAMEYVFESISRYTSLAGMWTVFHQPINRYCLPRSDRKYRSEIMMLCCIQGPLLRDREAVYYIY